MKIFELEYLFFKKIREFKGQYMRARLRGDISPHKFLRLGEIFLIFLLVFFSSSVQSSRIDSEVQPPQEVKAEFEKSELEEPLYLETKISGPVRIEDSPDISEVSAKAIAVLDRKSKSIFYEKEAEIPLPPASLTKVMSALLAIDSFSLEDTVKVPAHCAGLDGQKMGLWAGEELTVGDLLYGVLLLSAADATCTLASFQTTPEEFVAGMNTKAQTLGLKSIAYKNVIGLDEPGHLASARDLAKLADIAMENQVFREYVATREINVGGRHLRNTNEMLGTVSGVDGIKTGYTDEANGCLLISVKRGEKEIILVLLGSDARFKDAEKMIDWVFRVYKWNY